MNGQSCDGYLIAGQVNFLTGVDGETEWYDRCTGMAVCKVASGCVHEHVIVWDACPDCARQVTAQIKEGKNAKCCRCSFGDDGHTCPVIVQVQAPTA